MRQLVVVAILALVLLSACSAPDVLPYWRVADQGEACSTGKVEEKKWSDGARDWFFVLIKTDDGQIGYANVSAYQYVSLEVGDTICVIP